MALPAFAAAERRAAVDRYLLLAGPTAANPQHRRAVGEWDRQTDGRTPYRYIDPIPHITTRAVPKSALKRKKLNSMTGVAQGRNSTKGHLPL